MVLTDSAVTAIFTLVWQRCAHHCESSGNWQRYFSTVSCHRSYTNVHIVISVLSLQYHCCHNTVLVFAVTVLCTSNCLTAVGFLLCMDPHSSIWVHCDNCLKISACPLSCLFIADIHVIIYNNMFVQYYVYMLIQMYKYADNFTLDFPARLL